MSAVVSTPAQREALSEIVNIGMGQAGDKLARLLDTFIELSVPRIQFIDASDSVEAMRPTLAHETPVIVVRQAFASQMRGEALVVFDSVGCEGLAQLVGSETVESDELLLEVANLLIGASLTGIASQISHDLTFSSPSILGDGKALEELLMTGAQPWHTILAAEVSFGIEQQAFRARLIMFWPDDAIVTLHRAVDELLEGL